MVRLCADNPLIDPRVVDQTVQRFLEAPHQVDYYSNHHPPTFPDGQEVEILPFRALEIAWKEAKEPHEREHGTPFLWDQPERFRLGNYECPEGNLYHTYRWTLDYEEDYLLIKCVFEELYPQKEDFSMRDVMELLRQRPDIEGLNARHKGVTWHHYAKDVLSTYDQYRKGDN
jgi:spore coat polysaccharide biosynthesis protein SpsF